ncbi:hypothetical protein AKJ09_10977 [Labilithrix luteola]|uniref:Uncharacterized protein n=1 Tax=Labilithrix luteola TaxID=1391654 RepID=A0A0K1QEX4_9BACT|nr:hypothetical protein AKJ09_10977 [Labilithrix luteola]
MTSMGAHVVVVEVQGLALGASLFSELRPPFLEGRLALRIEGAVWQRSVSREAGQADLSWLVMRARLCFTQTLGLSLALCGVGEGGAFSSSATHALNPVSFTGPWVGAGAVMSAGFRPLPRLGIEIEAGILVPFTRDDVILRPNNVLYSTPAVVTWLAAGPILHFD